MRERRGGGVIEYGLGDEWEALCKFFEVEPQIIRVREIRVAGY